MSRVGSELSMSRPVDVSVVISTFDRCASLWEPVEDDWGGRPPLGTSGAPSFRGSAPRPYQTGLVRHRDVPEVWHFQPDRVYIGRSGSFAQAKHCVEHSPPLRLWKIWDGDSQAQQMTGGMPRWGVRRRRDIRQRQERDVRAPVGAVPV